ncbi:MAG: hypothetical protein RSG77_16975 [Hafnia sp.]
MNAESTLLNVTMSDAMVGCSMMGSTMSDPSYVAMLLLGDLDKNISVFLYYKKFETLPVYESDLQKKEVVELLNRLKDLHRNRFQDSINTEAENLERAERAEQRRSVAQRQRGFLQAAHEFKNMSNPAPEGTVDELAARYGVSKSHIRLLKREGRLHELTAPAAT